MKRRSASTQLSLFGGAAAGDGLAPHAESTRALAETLPAELRLGTSSWSFPGWRGIVWSEARSEAQLAREGLAVYARHPLFRTVGIDRTFYAPVEREVFAGWAAQVPAGFRFLIKAHDACTLARFPTHPRYGARRGETNDRFLDPAYATDRVVAPAVEGLGEKAGPILFQLPPQPLQELGGAAAFAERLHAFLDALPKGPIYAVELRNRGLLTPAYVQALEAAGAVHCCNVHAGMLPLAEQIRRVDPARGPAVVVRWMLHDGLDYQKAVARYAPFSALVDEDEATRETIARLLMTSTQRRVPTWVVINNKAEGSAPLSAEKLARRLAALRQPPTRDISTLPSTVSSEERSSE